MKLTRLNLINFKNYSEADLTFSGRVNCFVGNNGSGKTNLLDAIHYLALCKSYFNPLDSQNIKDEEPFFVVQGEFEHQERNDAVYCGLKRGQKKQFKLNQDEYSRLADHIGLIPLVMVSPTDHALITGGSEERRKLIDSVISQFDKAYLDDLIAYNRVLSQRNALLKQMAGTRQIDYTNLEIYDDQLIKLGNVIFEKRNRFLEDLTPSFNEFFNFITGDTEYARIAYDSQLHEQGMEALLKSHLKKDLRMQYTTAGIHKDDLAFMLGDKPIKKFGSQGQQKSFLIALKLAQFRFYSHIKNLKPILLLDDIFDKLDESRVTRLMELVNRDNFGQIFITDAHPERVAAVFATIDMPIRVFEVGAGVVAEAQTEIVS